MEQPCHTCPGRGGTTGQVCATERARADQAHPTHRGRHDKAGPHNRSKAPRCRGPPRRRPRSAVFVQQRNLPPGERTPLRHQCGWTVTPRQVSWPPGHLTPHRSNPGAQTPRAPRTARCEPWCRPRTHEARALRRGGDPQTRPVPPRRDLSYPGQARAPQHGIRGGSESHGPLTLDPPRVRGPRRGPRNRQSAAPRQPAQPQPADRGQAAARGKPTRPRASQPATKGAEASQPARKGPRKSASSPGSPEGRNRQRGTTRKGGRCNQEQRRSCGSWSSSTST